MFGKVLIASASTLITLFVGLQMIAAFAPQLIGKPADLTIVQSSEERVPFFENTLHPLEPKKFFLNDPQTIVRGNPSIPEFMGVGPHDLLGFRNSAVPTVTDVLTIGDSQTYGMNAPLSQNWPSTLQRLLGEEVTLYSAALGGWGALQYLEIFNKLQLRMIPRVAIIMFYAGNDSLESFKAAYAVERFRSFRLDSSLSIADLPSIPFPPKERWEVTLKNNSKVILSPTHRLLSNNPDSKIVKTGYEIMTEAARQISQTAITNGIQVVFALMPTAELAFAKQIASENIKAPTVYSQYVKAEQKQRNTFEASLRELEGAHYIDLLPALQKSVSEDLPIYPEKFDGHPNVTGYAVVARALRARVAPLLQNREHPQGIVRVIHNNRMALYSIENGTAKLVTNPADIKTKPKEIAELPVSEFRRLTVVQ